MGFLPDSFREGTLIFYRGMHPRDRFEVLSISWEKEATLLAISYPRAMIRAESTVIKPIHLHVLGIAGRSMLR